MNNTTTHYHRTNTLYLANPDLYVTWDDLYNIFFNFLFCLIVFSICVKYKKRQRQKEVILISGENITPISTTDGSV